MKTYKIIFWIATGLLSVMQLMSAGMYVFKYDEISQVFTDLGYSSMIIYPLAIAKILGIIAITTRKVNILTQLAYLGFAIDFILALVAHLKVDDGQFGGAAIAIVLLTVSYFTSRKAFR